MSDEIIAYQLVFSDGRTSSVLYSKDEAERFKKASDITVDVRPLYAAPPAPSVAVKALEWHKQAMSHSCGLFIKLARTSIGNYQVSHGDSGKFEVYLDKEPISAAYDGAPEAKAAAQSDYEARIHSALSAQVQDVAGWQPPQDCDGKEQLAFETWAASNRYDMHEHPLHYLFMDPKTNAARQGWKAALQYVRDEFPAAPAKQEG